MNHPDQTRFAWLLDQRGIPYCDEEHLQRWVPVRETRPDLYVRPYGFPPFFAEVGALDEAGAAPVAEAGGAAAGAGDRWLSRLVRRASRELRPYKGLGAAMVVVVDPPGEGDFPCAAEGLIRLAAALEDRRPYISSALVILPKHGWHRVGRGEREPPLRVRVVHNPAAKVALHLGIFAEPEDEHLGRSGDRWVDLRTGAPPLLPEGSSP